MQSATSVDAVNCIKLTPHPRRKKNALSSDVMVTYAEGVRNQNTLLRAFSLHAHAKCVVFIEF